MEAAKGFESHRGHHVKRPLLPAVADPGHRLNRRPPEGVPGTEPKDALTEFRPNRENRGISALMRGRRGAGLRHRA